MAYFFFDFNLISFTEYIINNGITQSIPIGSPAHATIDPIMAMIIVNIPNMVLAAYLATRLISSIVAYSPSDKNVILINMHIIVSVSSCIA